MIEAEKFWDGMAERYVKTPIGDVPAYEYTLGRSIAHLSAMGRVLEIGAGSGATAERIARHVKEMTASDISGRLTQIGADSAKEAGLSNMRHVHAGVGDPALGEGYDGILALNVLHLLPDPAAAIGQIHQMLNPGGLFISKTICTADGFHLFSLEMWKMRLMLRFMLPLMQLFGKAPAVRIVPIADLEQMVTGAGFEIIESGNHPAIPPRRFLVARKV